MIRCIRANNPGPMTLEGTNTWLIPDGASYVVVDPGPLLITHLDALAEETNGRVSRILLTHGHPDHTEGAREFAARVGADLSAIDQSWGQRLVDGERISIHSGFIQVLSTPGHTGDSATFLVHEGESVSLLTGDTVLGKGTSVVIPPDGRLRDYLASLERLEAIAEEFDRQGKAIALLPGHGPSHDSVKPVIEHYISHRNERLSQVRGAISSGITDAEGIVNSIYSDVPENVKSAALLSVQAQLEFLSELDG